MLGDVPVGAGDQHAVLGGLGARCPDLLSVDHPLLAVPDRLGAKTGEVASGARLAEELTPLLLTGEHRAKKTLLLLITAVGDNGWPRELQEER